MVFPVGERVLGYSGYPEEISRLEEEGFGSGREGVPSGDECGL